MYNSRGEVIELVMWVTMEVGGWRVVWGYEWKEWKGFWIMCNEALVNMVNDCFPVPASGVHLN